MKPLLVTVVGGTGFLGRYVVQELVKTGYHVRVISRHTHRLARLQPLGYQNQVVYVQGDVTHPRTIQNHLAGSYAVINLVGILVEKRKQRFSAIHAQCPERLAKMARESGVTRFIHISALGVDQAVHSTYARSKGTGERAVFTAFPEATVFRPGIIFGQEDNFFNQFACLASFFPFLPLIGRGETKFQPVYVADVAKAIVTSLRKSETQSRIYELGGPTVYSFRQLLQYVLKVTGFKRYLLPIPFGMAHLIGFFSEWLPKPLLTRDQVTLLKHDNLVQPEHDGFTALGIKPTALEMVVPSYLSRYGKNTSVTSPPSSFAEA